MTYGQAILGVSNSLLRDQRRTAATIAAPESGKGGQDLDLALTLADENARAGADPAFDAHIMPIGDLGYSSLGSMDAGTSHGKTRRQSQEEAKEGHEHLGESKRSGGSKRGLLPKTGLDGDQQH